LELYVNAQTSQKVKHVNGINDGVTGLRPSHQALLQLLDMTDPAWPSIAGVLREMADADVEINEAAVKIAVKLGAHRFAATGKDQRSAYHQATLTGASSDSIVYYIRHGDTIKIGTTKMPARRFGDLMPDEILAFEPGAGRQEKLRHRQFRHLRRRGEYFRIAPELLEHIRQIRQVHGDPDPTWPTAARPQEERGPAALPLPICRDKMTAAEAAESFGLAVQTVWAWARCGLISPAGKDDRGCRLFYAEHLIAVRDRTSARKRHAGR